MHWQHETADPSLLIKAGKSDLYSYGVRQYLLKQFKNDKDVKVYEGGSDRYVEEVLSSKFCLCPRGFVSWSRRLFDAVQSCIPVIIATVSSYRRISGLHFVQCKDCRSRGLEFEQIYSCIGIRNTKEGRMWRLKNRFLFHNQETDDDAFDDSLEVEHGSSCTDRSLVANSCDFFTSRCSWMIHRWRGV